MNKDSDSMIFKSFVTGYSRREGSYGILIGTALRPVANPLHDQATAATAALLALIAAQRVWDITSSKIGYLWSVEGELPRSSRESGRGALALRHGKCEIRGGDWGRSPN